MLRCELVRCVDHNVTPAPHDAESAPAAPCSQTSIIHSHPYRSALHILCFCEGKPNCTFALRGPCILQRFMRQDRMRVIGMDGVKIRFIAKTLAEQGRVAHLRHMRARSSEQKRTAGRSWQMSHCALSAALLRVTRSCLAASLFAPCTLQPIKIAFDSTRCLRPVQPDPCQQ